MKPTTLTITLAALLAFGGPAHADDWKDESGKGRGGFPGWGGPPPWAGQGDQEYFRELEELQKEREEQNRKYFKKQAEQRREAAERAEERWREGRERAEEWTREEAQRYRETERDYYRDPGQGRDFNAPHPQAGRGVYYGDAPLPPYRNDAYPLTDPYRLGSRPPYDPAPQYDYGSRGPYRNEFYPPPTDYWWESRQYTASALADQLTAQANAFLQAFSVKAGIVPEWSLFMVDATTLKYAAARFRDLAAQGADPVTLRAAFQPVAVAWQQLEARMARVSRGRIGPNIATALEMGRTVEQIGRLLR